MSNELGAYLPCGKYVEAWDELIKGSDISIYLKVFLNSKWEKEETTYLQKLLQEHGIPIDRIKGSSFWGVKITYFGNSAGTGRYTLKSESPCLDNETLILEVRKGKDMGKVIDLMKVVKEYVDYKEKEN